MTPFKGFGLLTFASCFFLVGCGSSGPAPVAEQDDIAAFVAENPDSDAGLEPVGDDAASQ